MTSIKTAPWLTPYCTHLAELDRSKFENLDDLFYMLAPSYRFKALLAVFGWWLVDAWLLLKDKHSWGYIYQLWPEFKALAYSFWRFWG